MTDEFQTTEGSESEAPKPRQRTAAGSTPHKRPGQSRSDYHFHTLIGEGSLGRVHEATRKSTGESCAIKEVRKSKLAHSPSLRQMVYEEVNILQRPALQSNPYIVKLYCSFQDEGFLYYCFELVKGGSLSKIIERLAAFRSCPVVPLHLIRLWIGELLSVVGSLNKERVVHRDIKPDNVLLADGHVRVIDFNNATAGGKVMLKPEATKVNDNDQEFGGTIPWWAPERVAVYKAHNGGAFVHPPGYEPVDPELGYTPELEIDLWSVGCIMYEMLTGRNPFLRATAELTADRILRYAQKMSNLGGSAMDGLEWPSTVTAEARDLCLKLLHPNPTVRLEVLQPDFETRHPFLADIHFRQLLSSVEAGDLVNNLLKSAEKQQSAKIGQISASILEFTPEIGQRFDGREIVGSLGVRNIAFAGVPSAIPEDGPADLYSSSTPVHKSMRLDDLSSTPNNTRRGPAPDPASRSSRRRGKPQLQPSQQHPPLKAPNPMPPVATPTIEQPVDPSGLPIVDTDGQGSCGRSTPDQRAASGPMPKEVVPTPETTAPPSHDHDDTATASGVGGAISSWAVEMSSDEFREFMIPHVVTECKRFVGEEVDEEDVVEAAGLLTWGPCKVSFTMAAARPPPTPPPEKPAPRFAVCRQVLQIDNAQQAPKPTAASASVAAAVGSIDMAPVGMMEDSPSAFCCAQSPSLVMFAKLRRWLRVASGFGLPEDPATRPGVSPLMTAIQVTPPRSAPSQLSQLPPAILPLVPSPPPPDVTPRHQVPDLICFGVLTSRFGLMLFIADCGRNECQLRGCLRPAPGSRVEVKRENGPRFSVIAENSLFWAEGDGCDTTRIDKVVIDVDCEEIAEKWGPHLHTAFTA